MMMKEIWAAVGDDTMRTFLSFAVYDTGENNKMHIDIDSWIASLQPDQQLIVRQIINLYAPRLQRIAKVFNGQRYYLPTFVLPK